MVVFMIVGKADPLYEMELAPANSNSSAGYHLQMILCSFIWNLAWKSCLLKYGFNNIDEAAYLNQFILYSSLDMVYSTMWTNQNM